MSLCEILLSITAWETLTNIFHISSNWYSFLAIEYKDKSGIRRWFFFKVVCVNSSQGKVKTLGWLFPAVIHLFVW